MEPALLESAYPVLRPEWVPRLEAHQVILFCLSTDQVRYFILDPATAVTLPLFNGRQTYRDINRAVRSIFKLGEADSRLFLREIIAKLNEHEDVIAVFDKPSGWQVPYEPLDFVLPVTSYHPSRRLSRPLSLLLFPSAWCQTDCRYCYADLDHLRSMSSLSLGQWEKILDEAAELGIQMIQLSGGDPMARGDSDRIISALVRRGFVFMVSTKCHISRRAALRIAESGFMDPVQGVQRYFQISVDSCDGNVADFLMRRKGYVDRSVNSVKNLLAAGIRTRIKAVITAFNYRGTIEYIEFFARLGVTEFIFSKYAPSHYRHDDSLSLTPEMQTIVAQDLSDATARHPDLSIQGDAMAPEVIGDSADANPDQRRWAERAGCSAGRTNLAVAPNGRAFLCEQMPQADPYFVGDLKTQTIREVWESPALLEFVEPPRERFTGTPCFKCDEFDWCIRDLGYCFRDSLFVYDRLHHPPPGCPRAPRPIS